MAHKACPFWESSFILCYIFPSLSYLPPLIYPLHLLVSVARYPGDQKRKKRKHEATGEGSMSGFAATNCIGAKRGITGYGFGAKQTGSTDSGGFSRPDERGRSQGIGMLSWKQALHGIREGVRGLERQKCLGDKGALASGSGVSLPLCHRQ